MRADSQEPIPGGQAGWMAPPRGARDPRPRHASLFQVVRHPHDVPADRKGKHAGRVCVTPTKGRMEIYQDLVPGLTCHGDY